MQHRDPTLAARHPKPVKDPSPITLCVGQIEYSPILYDREEDFESFVIDHHESIFGRKSIHIPGRNISSAIGSSSKPDLFVITYGPVPTLYVVEFELAAHTTDHIVGQVNRHLTIMRSLSSKTKEGLLTAFVNGLKEAPTTPKFPYKGYRNETEFIVELMNYPAIPLLIIDQPKPELDEQLRDRFREVQTREVSIFKEKRGTATAFMFRKVPSTIPFKCPVCKKWGTLQLKPVRKDAQGKCYHYGYVAHSLPNGKLGWHYLGKPPFSPA